MIMKISTACIWQVKNGRIQNLMKVLVMSDIHGNRTALEAVLDAAGNVGAVWCLGDIVGYGPDPNDCVSIIRDLPNLVCLRGNHDSAVIGLTEKGKFNIRSPESDLNGPKNS